MQGRKRERYSLKFRADRQDWEFTIHEDSGLPPEVCAIWKRKAFSTIPHEVRARFKDPRTRTGAERVIEALIEHLRGDEAAQPIARRGTPVEHWIKLFLDSATSPRATQLIGQNRPYSPKSIRNYNSIYTTYLKDDPFLKLTMEKVEREDILELLSRIAAHQITIGQKRKPKVNKDTGEEIEPDPLPTRSAEGTRAYEAAYSFIRMTFKSYQEKHPRWVDPFLSLKRPKAVHGRPRQGLEEDEVSKLFSTPGVFVDEPELERAICAAMFWAGLRRGEIFALMNEDLDRITPKIYIQHAWKDFDHKARELGDPKHHKKREVPFPDILKTAIDDLQTKNEKWRKENPKPTRKISNFVFIRADGTQPGATWYREHVYKWFERAKIDLGGRKISPHSARHSLASVLEAQGVPLRYIQDLLGHSDLKTTKEYLHTPANKINEITAKLNGENKKEEAPEEKGNQE